MALCSDQTAAMPTSILLLSIWRQLTASLTFKGSVAAAGVCAGGGLKLVAVTTPAA